MTDIREAKSSDIDDLVSLLYSDFRGKRHLVQKDIEKALSDAIESKERTILVSVNDAEKIQGYILCHWCPFPFRAPREGYISDLLIDGEIRGKGIGSELLKRIEEEARKKNCCRLMLNNDKETESYKRDFYKKNGFEERTGIANVVKMLKE